MDDIKTLEEIGLKEVSQKTHIEVSYLKNIIDADFANLSKVTTLGFIKIISREYKIDFSQWIDEANIYWDSVEEPEETTKIFIVQKPKFFPKFLKTLLFLILLVAILFGAYVFLNKKIDIFDSPMLENDTNYTYEQTPVVNQAKESLNITEASLNNSVEAVDINQSGANITKISDKNQSDVNTTISKNPEVVVAESVDLNTTSKTADINSSNFISPNTKLWIGIIYLDNFKRKSFLGEGNFTLDSSRDQLITTGHGNLNLYFNGKIKKFKTQRTIKFLIKDGNISEISIDKFKELNRGSLW